MIIAIDFDGTCVTHEFPLIGKDIGAIPVLKELVENNHQLILWTVRSDIKNPMSNDKFIIPVGGLYLTDAINWFKNNQIELYGVNKNPTQNTWSHSPKVYAQLYIDDAALGIPLEHIPNLSPRPFVDWIRVRDRLILHDIIKTTTQNFADYEFYRNNQLIKSKPIPGSQQH